MGGYHPARRLDARFCEQHLNHCETKEFYNGHDRPLGSSDCQSESTGATEERRELWVATTRRECSMQSSTNSTKDDCETNEIYDSHDRPHGHGLSR